MNKTINFEPTDLQDKAIKILDDKETNMLLFGGSASVGKTRLLVYWSLLYCFKYPGIRGLWGRSRLDSIKISILKTFFDITREWGIENYYNYNAKDKIITFYNGSEILIKDLFLYPTDPDFVKLGSVELTFCCIDEAAEITEKAFSILTSRQRYKLSQYNLIPKTLIVSNPTKGWLYDDFYKPHVEGQLERHIKVLLGRPEDNPWNPPSYIEGLKRLKGSDYQRLYVGNWDYDEDENDLFTFEMINDSFSNTFLENPNKIERYMTIDVAMGGKDSTIITIWNNMVLEKIIKIEKNDTNSLLKEVNRLKNEYKIRNSRIIVDAIGVGKGVADLISGCVHFISSNSALDGGAFVNIKTQLYYKMFEFFENREIYIKDKQYKEKIIEEFRCHKIEKMNMDAKAALTKKEDVKKILRRSPDFSDAIIMRSFFEIRKPNKVSLDFV